MIVPFRQQAAQPQAQPEGPQPDPNFLLMAASMMYKEYNEPMKHILPGKPEGEFIAPSGLDFSGADDEQTNRLNKELTKITKPTPKERSI